MNVLKKIRSHINKGIKIGKSFLKISHSYFKYTKKFSSFCVSKITNLRIQKILHVSIWMISISIFGIFGWWLFLVLAVLDIASK